MNYYQEIRLLPDEGANLGFLWSKVFQQIHIALVEHGFDHEVTDEQGKLKTVRQSAIAMSIPEYGFSGGSKPSFPLGDKIRLFANTQAVLEKLNIAQWLIRLEDYVQIKTIKAVPADAKHVRFVRQHYIRSQQEIAAKTHEMATFKAKETGESVDKWLDEFTQQAPKPNDKLPFIHSKSLSSSDKKDEKRFCIYIEMETSSMPKQGSYTCYGLSFAQTDKQATVPWF